MRALVTGATGFLGQALVEQLRANGHAVRGLARDANKAKRRLPAAIEVALGDVTDPASLAEAVRGIDVVFHAAALVTDWAPWSEFERVTVQGTVNLLRAAQSAGVGRFVHISTIRVYDDRFAHKQRVVTEDAPRGSRGFRPFGSYARAKVQAENAVWDAQKRGEAAVSVIRPAWIYGPGDTTIVPPLLAFLRQPMAAWLGRTDPCADPIYVTDVADCALAAATSPAAVGQAYNAAPPDEISVRQFLTALCQAMEIEPPTRVVPKSAAVTLSYLAEGVATLLRRRDPPAITRTGVAILTEDVRHSPAKALAELGWRAQVSLDVGVQRTAAWLKAREAEREAGAALTTPSSTASPG